MDFANDSIPESSNLESPSKSNEVQQDTFYSIVGTTEEVLSDNNDLAAGIPITSDTQNTEDILLFKDENGLVYYAQDQDNIVLLPQDTDFSQFITVDGNYHQVVVGEAGDNGLVLTDGNSYETVETCESNEQNVSVVNNNEYQIVVADSSDQATPIDDDNNQDTEIVEQNEKGAIMPNDDGMETAVVENYEQEITTTSSNDEKIESSDCNAQGTAIITDPDCETNIPQNIDPKSSITTNESHETATDENVQKTPTISHPDHGPLEADTSNQEVNGMVNTNGSIVHEAVATEINNQGATAASINSQEIVTTESIEQETVADSVSDYKAVAAEKNTQKMKTHNNDVLQTIVSEKKIQNVSATRNHDELTLTQTEMNISSNNIQKFSRTINKSHEADKNEMSDMETDVISADEKIDMKVESSDQKVNMIHNDVGQTNDKRQNVNVESCKTKVPEANGQEKATVDEPDQETKVDNDESKVVTSISSNNHEMEKSQNDHKKTGGCTNDQEVTVHDGDSHDTMEEIEYIVEEVIEFDDASQHEVTSNDVDRSVSKNSSSVGTPKVDKLRIKEDIHFSRSGVRKPVRTYERKNKNVVPYKSDNQVYTSQVLSKDRDIFMDEGNHPDCSKHSSKTSHKFSPSGRHKLLKTQCSPKKPASSNFASSDISKRSSSEECKYSDVKLFEELEEPSPNDESYLDLNAQHVESVNMTGDSCIDLEPTPSPVKRRGRPPKLKSPEAKNTKSPGVEIKQNLHASKSEIDSTLETSLGQTTPISIKKRRGRPPRIPHDAQSTPHEVVRSPNVQQVVPEPSSDSINEDTSLLQKPTPKKRGRRPKVASELNSTADETSEEKTPNSAILPKRRSGRPSRGVSDHTNISTDKSDNVETPKTDGAEENGRMPDATDPSSPPKKRRGRPPRPSLVPNAEQNVDQSIAQITCSTEAIECHTNDIDDEVKSDAAKHSIEPESCPLSKDLNQSCEESKEESSVAVPKTDAHELGAALDSSVTALTQSVEDGKTLKRKRGRQSKIPPDENLLDVSKADGLHQTSVNKDVSIDSVGSPKKRRGRPPKVRPPVDETADGVQDDQNLSIKDDGSSSTNKSQNLDKDNTPVTKSEVQSLPKKRGRWSKAQNSPKTVAEHDVEHIPSSNVDDSNLPTKNEDDTAETPKVESDVPPPKRRGRPPKVRDSINESVKHNLKQEIVDPPTDMDESGILNEEELIVESQSIESTAPPKKRRGRQPKNRDSLIGNTTHSVKQEIVDSPSAMDTSTVQDETPSFVKSEPTASVPKRMGRPPKIRKSLIGNSEELGIIDDKVVTPTINDATTAQAVSESIANDLTTPAPRRRGRLPKIRHSIIESVDPTKEPRVNSPQMVDNAGVSLDQRESLAESTPSAPAALAPKRRGRQPKSRQSMVEASKEFDAKSDVNSPLVVDNVQLVADGQDGPTNVMETELTTPKISKEDPVLESRASLSENSNVLTATEQIESMSSVESADDQDDTLQTTSEPIASPRKRMGRPPKKKRGRPSMKGKSPVDAQNSVAEENSPIPVAPEVNNLSIPITQDDPVNTESPSLVPLKKRRGRQPKQSTLNNSIQNSSINDATDSRSRKDNTESCQEIKVETLETKIPDVSVPLQKKRGRQRQSLAHITQSTTDSSEPVTADTASSVEESPLTQKNQDVLTGVPNTEPPQKRRGRKPKAAIALDTSVNIPEENLPLSTVQMKTEQPDSDIPVPKRKGRPPKNRTLVEKNDSISNGKDILSPVSSNDATRTQKDQNDAAVLHDVPPQKRRGRKPKSQTVVQVMEVDSENRDQNSSQAEVSDSQKDQLSKEPVPVKDSLRRKSQSSIIIKRRSGGRPPKISGQATEDTDSRLVMQTPGSLKKRKRGRQAKFDVSHNESAEEDDVISSMTVSKKSRKDVETFDDQSPLKKRRGRPPRSEANQGTTPDIKKIVKQEDSDVKVKRRGRPPKQEINISCNENSSNDQPSRQLYDSSFDDDGTGLGEESDDETESDELDEHEQPTKSKSKFTVRRINRKGRKGRPRANERVRKRELDYQPHHSFRSKRPRPKIEKIVSPKTTDTSPKITCGKCNLEMKRKIWRYHNLKHHNDLAWIAGTEKPDYENDDKLLKRVLFEAIKKRNGSLICEVCHDTKRSVLGHLSHVMFCGKTEEEIKALMVTCPGCNAVIKPSSLEYHERIHRQEQIDKRFKEINRKLEQENGDEACDSPDHKPRRKAAQKAVTRISEFTAQYKDNDEKGSKLSEEKSDLIKNFIEKPKLKKRTPSNLMSKWKRDLLKGIDPSCQQPECQFTTKCVEEMREHYSMCNFKPRESYMCRICKFQSLSKAEILDHALLKHSNECNEDGGSTSSDTDFESGDDDLLDGDRRTALFKTPRPIDKSDPSYKMFSFINQNERHAYLYNKALYSAFLWTLEFERENFQLNSFQNYKPNTFKLLEEKKMNEYLPELENSMLMTCKTAGKSRGREWQSWKRFQGDCMGDIPTFFVGGPVWAIAWLPIPTILSNSQGISQYIALSTHRNMDVEYSIEGSHSGKNMIQIWNLGKLDHKSSSVLQVPQLEYSIIHEGGTVWHLEWCPSGCYQDENISEYTKESDGKSRMGLLAAACSDGCVRIYSLVFAKDLPVSEQNAKYPVYETNPVLTLVLDQRAYEKKLQSWQVTKLSWSKESGHNMIAAGFSNGYVALWDLASESPLFKFSKNDNLFLIPVKQFHPHFSPVTMVHLVPQDGKRFLVTASLDRYYKLWDLECLISPVDSFQRGFVTDGSWMTHWNCALLAFDDALSMNRNYSLVVPTRAYTYRHYNVFPAGSTCYTISGSDFGNSIASGTLAGEVLVMFPPQMLYLKEMERIIPRKRQICKISFVKTVELDRTTVEKASPPPKNSQPKKSDVYDFKESTYEDSKDRYGIELCIDMTNFKDGCISNRLKKKNKSLTCDSMKNVPIEQYPFMSVNRVSWNPNAWSYLWLAVGYQNGFVQLLPFKSLVSKGTGEKLLTPHIESVLDSETGTLNES